MNKSINNFSIRIGTINGSGSQTANTILLKSFFRMSLPVGSKNYFPSNIQGMSTWFTIRVNSKGYIGPTKKFDIVVNFNSKTLVEDVKYLNSDGLLVIDDNQTNPLDLSQIQSQTISIPVRKILDELVISSKYRKYAANMLYVGVVAEYLEIPEEILNDTIRSTFPESIGAANINLSAVVAGRNYYKVNYAKVKKNFLVEKVLKTEEKVLMDGNTASAMGLIFGGCSFVSWYPITPSTSVIEMFKELSAKYREVNSNESVKDVIVQAEDELSAICMVLGAGWAGARALTATSGPGLSLMAEASGYAYYAEIPAVIWNVQRAGPSTGLPTRTAQGDLLFSHFLSHGDAKHICLIPGNLNECFEFGQICFDLAEELQTLVIVLSDLDLGMNIWSEKMWSYPTEDFKRGKVITNREFEDGAKFIRYQDKDNDGICYRTLPGNPHQDAAYFTRGSGHNSLGQYTENPEQYAEVLERLDRKWNTAKNLVPDVHIKLSNLDKGSRKGIVYYGALEQVVLEALDNIESKFPNIESYDKCRVRALPFTLKFENFIKSHDEIIVLDQNKDGQMFKLICMEYPEFSYRFKSKRYYNGLPVFAEDIERDLLDGK